MELRELVFQRVRRMVSENKFIAGVVLFGSLARGEETERSDVDLLILWDGLKVNSSRRHVYVYEVVSKYFPSTLRLTVLEMEYTSFIKVKKLTPLILNIIYDGIVLYDKYGRLREFMKKVREELKVKGLKRRKTGRTYYWILPKPGAKVRLEVE